MKKCKQCTILRRIIDDQKIIELPKDGKKLTKEQLFGIGQANMLHRFDAICRALFEK